MRVAAVRVGVLVVAMRVCGVNVLMVVFVTTVGM
jgi:hypothetical protein